MSIEGLGPHSELATPADQLLITPEQATAANADRYHLAIVLHTTASDWSRQQTARIVATLGAYSAVVTEVVDCGFDRRLYPGLLPVPNHYLSNLTKSGKTLA